MRCAARVLLGTERSQIPMMLLPPGVAPASVTRVSVDVADRPGILLRVLGVCQRRGARVLAMTYGPAGEHARIELAVSADERHVQLLHGRLAALIDVHGVAIR
jgi:acetolactate synthase regulatory subunit